MLRELKAEDYAIIDRVEVRLVEGLNVLTGETGAGKSILVGALSFALGEKVTDEVIRKGADACRVEAVFELEGPVPPGLTEAAGDKGGVTVRLAREIRRGGRSRCRINGDAATLTRLREVGDLLVDFHGQHDHQVLLNPSSHVDFLDGFGHLVPEREELGELRRALAETRRKIEDIEQEISDIRSREEQVRFEIREIEGLGVGPGEDEVIEREIALLQHGEQIVETGAAALDAIYEGDRPALERITEAEIGLERLKPYSEDLASLAEELEQARIIVKEVGESIRDRLADLDLDPGRLEALRERRAAIERVKRRYGSSLEDVLGHLRRLKAGLEGEGGLELELRDLREEGARLEKKVLDSARRLSDERRKAAARFRKMVESELRSLGIPGAGFGVVFEELEDGLEVTGKEGEPIRVAEKGMEGVEFFVRTNEGEDLMPLRRIASGGEISRVMLGLKKILAEIDEVDTLVFDEIDAGIGGSIARVVAEKLAEVGRSRQVICITHLPQIAGAGELHLAVDKRRAGGRTITTVTEVRGDQRVREIARMIGGKRPPRSAVDHAEEIMKRSVSK
jgi:DNA repair protein RecN (Recombination protein N)